ncbi:MAG: isopentenyl phosphate kinase family protein [Chloroflexaceae bacterium]|nr:isopentenyl phosphate kinase family protein [Chloroflexaceae bacterium]
MEGLTFLKLGGSVITNKRGQEAADLSAIRSLAEDLHAAHAARPGQRLLLGHGSGSFGHLYAARYGIHTGLSENDDWIGFALTSAAALRLNRIVVDVLLNMGVPALSLQPSASLCCEHRSIVGWNTEAIEVALRRGLVPVIHGDVAFDHGQGCAIISTETLFTHLALHTRLRPARIVLVGEEGVYTADPRKDPTARLIPFITTANISQVLEQVGGSHAVDVTGGMRSKVEAMWNLVQQVPELEIHLIGSRTGLLRRVLSGEPVPEGTVIRR